MAWKTTSNVSAGTKMALLQPLLNGHIADVPIVWWRIWDAQTISQAQLHFAIHSFTFFFFL